MEKIKNQKRYLDYNKEKRKGVTLLANLDKKKIDNKDIREAAKQAGLPTESLKKGWLTFLETGGKSVDRRVKNGKGSIKLTPSVVCQYSKQKDLSFEEAGKIIVEYMTTDINSRELCNKYEIPTGQFYGWIHELNVAGTLLGEKVLDPKQYAKVEVLDVIWMHKKPKTKRASITALNPLQVAAYKRVATVLLKYLVK